LTFGQVYRSEEYGKSERYTDWQRHASQKDTHSAHIASYELLCQLFLGSIKIGLSRESLDLTGFSGLVLLSHTHPLSQRLLSFIGYESRVTA
jgi:hypothetical protein